MSPSATGQGSKPYPDGAARGRRPTTATIVFAGLIGMSAFLLFSVEPMIGRLVLPVFGGTPTVWATTLFFFQAVLLLGYLDGNLSVTRLGLRRGALAHVILVGLAFAALAVAPAQVGSLRVARIPEVLNLLGMLLLTIGLPAFVLTTTTPLLSAWYAATSPRGADDDAYWLYALSNAGSLLALVAYPFLIESWLGLTVQREVWAVAFVGFGLLLVACALWSSSRTRTDAPVESVPAVRANESQAEAITWRRRLTWLLLAAVPAGLLSAVTTFIATDLVSAPLLWLIPLSIYLLTFVVAFSSRGRRLVPAAITIAPATITLMWVPLGSAGGWPILPLVLLEYGGLAVVAAALHGRLAFDRPGSAHLTEFYLIISVGGALASAFVAIVAPLLFAGVWEFPILLVVALVALAVSQSRGDPIIARAERPRSRRAIDLSPFFAGASGRVGPYVVLAGLLTILLLRNASLGAEAAIRWVLVGGLILLVGARPAFLATSTALVLALAVFVLQPAAIFRDRSFFGVTEVLRPVGGPYTTLMNGTTVHGVQSTDPARARVPTSYYSLTGPFGDVFRQLSAEKGPKEIGIIGLGAGALTVYAESDWRLTYYEIDPLVAQVASDPRYFTYLSGAATRPEIVLGDARQSLQLVPDQRFDALFVDAFSSDAIPIHLITQEAFALYARVLKPDGLLVVHIPNRYYDLAPAVAGAASRNGLVASVRVYNPSRAEAATGAGSTVLTVASRSAAVVDAYTAAGWKPLVEAVPPITDDFMDVLRFLRPLW
jgi:SAM-dependent methyltransferase